MAKPKKPYIAEVTYQKPEPMYIRLSDGSAEYLEGDEVTIWKWMTWMWQDDEDREVKSLKVPEDYRRKIKTPSAGTDGDPKENHQTVEKDEEIIP